MAAKKPAVLPQPVDPFGGKRFWIIFAGRQCEVVGQLLQDKDINTEGLDDVIGAIFAWSGEAAAACASIPPRPIPPIPNFLVNSVGIENEDSDPEDEDDEDDEDEDDDE